jgi:heme/copper-type cytochrome/quinol oxidase subunit 4
MTLVFTSVLLVFMIYPAIKIVGFLETKMNISDKTYNVLTVVITIILALIVGAGLYFI